MDAVNKRNVVLYARYARLPRPAGQTCKSCAEQLEGCCEFANFNQWTVIGEHHDDATAPKRADNRPGLQAAITQCTEQKAALIVLTLSRLALNAREAHRILQTLLDNGADLVVIEDNRIDTATDNRRLLLTALKAAAELESEQIAQRTAKAMSEHQSKGKRMSGQPPYGYKVSPKDPSRLILNKDEQKAIERIKELAGQGKSLNGICRILTQEGFQPRQHRRHDGTLAGRWHASTIKKILCC